MDDDIATSKRRRFSLKQDTSKLSAETPSAEVTPRIQSAEVTPRIRRRKTVKHLTLAAVETEACRPQLLEDEAEFIKAIEVGDLPTARRMLLADPEFNVNCTDLLGRTPLRLAVEGEHLEIVELLLGRTDPKNMYDALLLAISLDHDEIALTILKHPVYIKIENFSNLINAETGPFSADDSLFSTETNPLILAAQRNRYEVVSVLLQRGETICHPHNQDCECHDCKASSDMDELRFAKSRLNAFKGLASECYISLYYDDPILASFEMRQTLLKAATREKHYREEYESLAKGLSNFVVKLLDNVRGYEELFVLLREGADADGSEEESKSSAVAMSRLQLALKRNEKGFVSHPSCQKLLTSTWYGDYAPIRHKLPMKLRPFATLLLVLVLPFLASMYCILPITAVKKFLQIPFIKFVGQSTSFIVFLTLILVFSITETPSSDLHKEITAQFAIEVAATPHLNCNFTKGFRFESMALRPTLPGITQILICTFILGLIWQECKQLYSLGIGDHFASLFNVIDYVLLSLYVASFTLRYLTYYKTWKAGEYFLARDDGLRRFVDGDPEAMYNFYWLIADRLYWAAFDPINICEGLFSVANVLSFSRLFYLLAANEQLGPLQVSLRRMITDIMNFFVIFSIVVIAFMVGLNNLYWYYEPSIRQVVEANPLQRDHFTNAESAFGTIESTFITVFWALFGMGEPQVVELGPDYAANAVTGRIGYWVFGGYNLVAVIVLLNMLIAMMSRSFELIQNDENMEWKFARAELYMDYMTDQSFLMVPVNIVPSTYSIFTTIKFILESIFKSFSACFGFLRNIRKTFNPQSEGLEENRNGIQMTFPGESTINRQYGWVHQLAAPAMPSSWENVIPEIRSSRDEEESSEVGQTNLEERRHHERRRGGFSTKEPLYQAKAQGQWPQKLRKELSWLTQDPSKSSKTIKNLTYNIVIKSVLKRFIFNTQKTDNSQVEADMDELKQDLSSFRYEVMNALSTKDQALQEAINVVNAKLDLANSMQGPFNQAQEDYDKREREKSQNLSKKTRSIDVWEGSWNDVPYTGKGQIPSIPTIEIHEEIVPQNVDNYFYDMLKGSPDETKIEDFTSTSTLGHLSSLDSINMQNQDYEKRDGPMNRNTDNARDTPALIIQQDPDNVSVISNAINGSEVSLTIEVSNDNEESHNSKDTFTQDDTESQIVSDNKRYTDSELKDFIRLLNKATNAEVKQRTAHLKNISSKRQRSARPLERVTSSPVTLDQSTSDA